MPDASAGWALIAHGGAKEIAADEEQGNREGLRCAIGEGSRILESGGSALDAVVAVVKSLEADPVFNAGLYGSVQNEDGIIEMDASIMDGATLEIGAFAGIQNIEHPVLLARALLCDKAVFLVGDGATKFAREQGFPSVAQPEASRKRAGGCDTVGCVARDKRGNLAAATSTGGLEGSRAGRVGDVPLPGCGFYADNSRGAASCSGQGEAIARVLLASEFLHFLEDLPADEAAEKALRLLGRVNGEAGIIAICPNGAFGWAHNSPHFAVGIAREDSQPRVYLRKGEKHAA